MASDPTRTKGIRGRWTRDYNRRYRTLKRRTRALLSSNSGPLDPLFVDFFSRWLDGQVNELLFEFAATPPPMWQNQYIDQAFARGLAVSERQIKRQDSSFVSRSANNRTAVGLLYTRGFEDLKGITAEMKAQMNRNLVRSIQAEATKAQLAKSVIDRIDKIGMTRSKLLAQTAAVSSHNTGMIDNVQQYERDTGEEGRLLWVTQQDQRVRTTHALRNRKLFKPKAAFNLINEPNCRCSLRAVVGAELAALESPADRKRRTRVRKEGLAESDQATEERRFRATLERGRRAEGLREGG